MSVAVALLAIAVIVLMVLVAGLLRSHAAILRRLHELGAGLQADASAADTPVVSTDLLPQPVAQSVGRAAADLVGTTPGGDAVAYRVADVAHDTVLVFLSTGCKTCQAFWDELATADLPGSARLIVVTKGDRDESPVAVADVAPAGIPLVMSSEAWTDYNVPGSPYLVHVDGPSGTVRGEGTSASWDQVRRMLLEASGDLELRRSRKASADRLREQEADEALLAAGIRPGDASLYPDAILDDAPEQPT